MTEDQRRSELGRRTLIKRGAAAGAVVWATPTIGTMSATNAWADVRFTNCFPRVTYQLLETGANCSEVEVQLERPVDSNCCSNHVYALIARGDCGPSCTENYDPDNPPLLATYRVREVLPSDNGVIGAEIDTRPASCNLTGEGILIDTLDCDTEKDDVRLYIFSEVTCADGTVFECLEIVDFNVEDCVSVADGVVRDAAYFNGSPPRPIGCVSPTPS